MEIMRSFTITKNDADQRLDKFISKSVPALPKSLMYKYIRLKRIKVNRKRAEISTRLNEGDIVDMYIGDEFFKEAEYKYDFLKAGKELDIVYEDENIIICNKKAGLLCHADKNEYNDNLINRILRYLYDKKEYDPKSEHSFTPALANRIDRGTSGLVMCAKNAESLRILNEKIKSREVKKYYLCIVSGHMPKSEGTLKGYLAKNEEKNKVIIKNREFEGSKEIVTKYRVLAENKGFSLLEIELLTGRTHQIRAQFAHISHPLLGDKKYGDRTINAKYNYSNQALFSYKVKFDFTSEAGALDYLGGKSFEAEKSTFKKEFGKLQ